jgi:hypothetical protein
MTLHLLISLRFFACLPCGASKNEALINFAIRLKWLYGIYLHPATSLHYITLAIMPKCCIICSAVASPEIKLQYCAQCQSALYCSRACQRIDCWKKQHKEICKLLNVGHGDRQVQTAYHTEFSLKLKEQFESDKQWLNDGVKRFFKLFEQSTFEGGRAAPQRMKKYAKRQNKEHKTFLVFHTLKALARFSNSEMHETVQFL